MRETNKKLLPLILTLLFATAGIAYAMVGVNHPVQLLGKIKADHDIQVYGNAECTQIVTGWVEPFETKDLWVKCTNGTTISIIWYCLTEPFVTVKVNETDWIMNAGQPIAPGQVLHVVLKSDLNVPTDSIIYFMNKFLP